MPEEIKNVYGFDAGYDADFDAVPEAAPVAPAAKVTEPAKLPQEAAERGKEAPAHNPMSLRFAKEFDFTEEEIQGMTPRELDAAVMAAHRVWLKTSKQVHRNELVDRGGDKPQAAPVAAAPAPSETKAAPKPEDDEYAEFENLHPEVIAAIRKGRDKDKAVIDGLHKKIEAADAERAAVYQQQMYDAVDLEFAKMPAEVKLHIGEGGRGEVGELEHTVRKRILEKAEKDDTANLTFAQKMHKAAKALIPGATAKVLAPKPGDEDLPIAEEIPAAKPVPAKDTATGRFTAKTQAEREEAWVKSGTAVPTHRESPLPPGEKKAMQTARKLMLAKGLLSDEDMPEGSFLPSHN